MFILYCLPSVDADNEYFNYLRWVEFFKIEKLFLFFCLLTRTLLAGHYKSNIVFFFQFFFLRGRGGFIFYIQNYTKMNFFSLYRFSVINSRQIPKRPSQQDIKTKKKTIVYRFPIVYWALDVFFYRFYPVWKNCNSFTSNNKNNLLIPFSRFICPCDVDKFRKTFHSE